MSLMPAKMKRVDMLILSKDERRVSTLLGRIGLLHLVEVASEGNAGLLAGSSPRVDLQKCHSLLTRLETLRDRVGISGFPAVPEGAFETLDAVEQQIAAVEGKVNPLIAERSRLQLESEGLQDELARLDAIAAIPVPIGRLLDSPFIHLAVGSISVSHFKRLASEVRENIVLFERPAEGDRLTLIAVSSRNGRFALETLLKQHNFASADLATLPRDIPAEVISKLMKRLDEIRAAQGGIFDELKRLGRESAPALAALYRRLKIEEAMLLAQMNFGHTSSTCLIGGWLPAESLTAVSERLLAETDGRVIIQIRDPQETGVAPADVPVLFSNPKWIKPFELLVSGFGLPRYNEIEPTILFAVSFLIMYGLMFGDVGHGALLALIGMAIRWRSRDSVYRDLGVIIAFAGVSAFLFGFVYGSVFGMENLIRPLVLQPMPREGSMRMLFGVPFILAFPVLLGVVLISLGVIVNIVNHFRTGDYLGAIFDRFGVVGIVFYWGALGLGLKAILFKSVSLTLPYVLLLVALPLVILFLREPIIMMLSRKHHEGEGGVALLMEGGVGIMETVSSYLANTVSFARVGAFALAHAGLCLAIFSMVELVRTLPSGVIWSGAVLVVGNAVVLLLEGLIVFVQCMRLEYYEFFGKFFEGSGREYKPFKFS